MRGSRLARDLDALELATDVLGPPELVAAFGPDYIGRYERCFAALQNELHARQDELDCALCLSDLAEQARRVAPGMDLARCLDEALDSVMSLPNLVALFGEGATRNPVEPFSRHFANRIRVALATLPAASNPFLWQMLRGRYPFECPADWLTIPRQAPVALITWQQAYMTYALRGVASSSFDLVHLSNILDWLSPVEATATLQLAATALRRGGQVIIRQAQLDARYSWLRANVRVERARGNPVARDRPKLLLSGHSYRAKSMNVHALADMPEPNLAYALARFEEQFRYPLGKDQSFRISHGEDYPRFFARSAMGSAS